MGTFHARCDAFLDILHVTGSAVTGASLLELFDLPPTIVVPAECFPAVHLFLQGLNNVVRLGSHRV